MPYRNSDDKKAWRRRNRDKQRQYAKAFQGRHKERLAEERKARLVDEPKLRRSRSRLPQAERKARQSRAAKEHFRRWLEFLNQQKVERGGKCCRCGYSDIRALDWHHTKEKHAWFHRDPHKGHRLSRSMSTFATAINEMPVVIAELDKCELICRNCHQIVTIENGDHKKTAPKAPMHPEFEFVSGPPGGVILGGAGQRLI